MKLNQRRLLTDYFTSLKGGNTCVIHGRTWMFHVTSLNMHKQPGCSENSKYAEYVNNSSHEERGSLQDPHPHGVYWGWGGGGDRRNICACCSKHTHTRKDMFTTSKKVNSGGTFKVSSPKRKIPSLSSKHVSQLTD